MLRYQQEKSKQTKCTITINKQIYVLKRWNKPVVKDQLPVLLKFCVKVRYVEVETLLVFDTLFQKQPR